MIEITDSQFGSIKGDMRQMGKNEEPSNLNIGPNRVLVCVVKKDEQAKYFVCKNEKDIKYLQQNDPACLQWYVAEGTLMAREVIECGFAMVPIMDFELPEFIWVAMNPEGDCLQCKCPGRKSLVVATDKSGIEKLLISLALTDFKVGRVNLKDAVEAMDGKGIGFSSKPLGQPHAELCLTEGVVFKTFDPAAE